MFLGKETTLKPKKFLRSPIISNLKIYVCEIEDWFGK